ncbi:hypothetical protein OF83DRAFT_167407 [Amylostereum chailletii]|nr:hypothetical protein OF83DRAFT_167407 [Amylostereum chailletii]
MASKCKKHAYVCSGPPPDGIHAERKASSLARYGAGLGTLLKVYINLKVALCTMSLPVPGKAYVLTNVATGTALDLSDKDNQSVVASTKTSGENQQVCCLCPLYSRSVSISKGALQWYFEEKAGGVAIHCKHQVKYLAVKGTPKNSAEIVAEDTHNPQVFSAQPGATAGTFQILVKDTVFVLDVTQSNPAPGTPVIAYNNNKTNNQLWTASAVANK